MPRISVVIAVRNGAKTLQRALDSVFMQTDADVEIVVIDGASTDGTQAILQDNDSRLTFWLSEPDRGVYSAWNKALDHATGDWIGFLGADDRYGSSDSLVRLASAVTADGGRHDVAYGTVRVVREDGSLDREMGIPWEDARVEFGAGVMIPHPATFHRRELFDRHGRFDERYRIAGDYEFLLRELLDHDALFVPELHVDMGAGGLSDRPANTYTLMREIHRARYAHGLVSAPGWRSGRLVRSLVGIWVARTFGQRTADRAAGIYRSLFGRSGRSG